MEIITMTPETMRLHGFEKITRVDGKYCELIIKGKTAIRQYYLNNSGAGYFYYNDIRYTIDAFVDTVPAGQAQDKKKLEKAHKFAEKMKGNNNAAGVERKVEVEFDAPEPEQPKKEEPKTVRHPKYETIKTCIKSDIPVYLVGEAGTGKNYTLQEIADDLGLTFYFTNSIQQEYKVTGFIDAGGVYHETEFYKAFTNGGLFFLDEIDASIPEVLVLLNAAIANRYFEFPNGRVDAHKDFRVVAAGNTIGSGANDLYTGRLVLDSATLDRFVVIEFDYDRGIEMAIANGNEALVNFTRQLRDFCKKNGIRATFSYRMIISVTKLEAAGLDLKEILRIAVLKGLDKDTIKTLRLDYTAGQSGRYYYALKDIQAAA